MADWHLCSPENPRAEAMRGQSALPIEMGALSVIVTLILGVSVSVMASSFRGRTSRPSTPASPGLVRGAGLGGGGRG